MIEVDNLSKNYAGVRAVRHLSFQVARGEIVGFLGPNGAGKTTTMRILSGYLPPTDGKVMVAGYDVLTHPLEVRRRIGYMPENIPLYGDMRIDEFLRFRARLKGVSGRRVRERVEEVKRLCSLSDVGRKIIRTLSKGYRQRVGLADALVHEPDLLILDEPTIGLDPNQIRLVRHLIKDLGKKHTILLSTHILSEVEMTCSRVLILNKGKIEAADTPENMTRIVRGGGLRLEVQASKQELEKKLLAIDDVEDLEFQEEEGWVKVYLFIKPGEDVRSAVDQVIKKEKWPLREMIKTQASLEEAFIELTQE